ncbi:tyrosine-type recombinase/integrase [Candidatus Borrarchaeum sp.]|uniref:tyrosine-type recombinase/integrase n=1 Tax=Candidatus Borrarchaeum sp. TaxID=2846742 RepID=UPI00257C4202|nr:tyrosine-type recombinase/integrase [Candidatus Borrarchaeum sp.]
MATTTKETLKEWSQKHSVVENWLTSFPESTQKQYRPKMKHFCEFFDITPEDFLEEAQLDVISVKTKLNKWYNHLRRQKKTLNYSAVSEAIIKSFLKYYEIKIQTPKRKRAKKYKRKALRKEQIKDIVNAASNLRDKALIVVAFQTGMGIGDLLNLDYSDVKEAIEDNKDYHIIEYIRGKEGVESTAVIGRDSISLLKQYIKWRTQLGNVIKDDSPLFTGIKKHELQNRLSNRTAQYIMRHTIVKAGLITFEDLEKYGKQNPLGFHAIRKAFSSVAKQNGIPFEQAEMSMGHKLPFDSAYDEYKEHELIRNFKLAEPHLSISVDTRELEEKAKDQEEDIETLKHKISELELMIKALAKSK